MPNEASLYEQTTGHYEGLSNLGRNQALLMLWLNEFVRGNVELPAVYARTYFDSLVIDPRDYDPRVHLPHGVSGQPNWHQTLFTLAQRGLVVISLDTSLTTTIHELRFPENFRFRLSRD